jgi:hypothetical protein
MKTLRRLRPYSRLLSNGCIDGRSREGKFLAACRAELVAHVGNPTTAERVLIDRLAWLRLHVMLIDEKVVDGKPMTPHDARTYLAFNNSISRGMRQLGLKSGEAAARPRTYTDFAREYAERQAREAASS